MSTTPEIDIRALANLARLELSDTEVEKMQQGIPVILAFVEQIQSVVPPAGGRGVSPDHRNVTRADADTHESGIHTETLLSAAPDRVGNRVSVKQVLTRKK